MLKLVLSIGREQELWKSCQLSFLVWILMDIRLIVLSSQLLVKRVISAMKRQTDKQ